mmetsp:Transcript_85371/g.178387  ORF Transcript_85371/g.178387 Transcript_85371/m.178387 type:complete len:161 (-) Transcript_85371:164-646(-)
MGNALFSGACDRDGNRLTVGDWVECGNARTADIAVSLGWVSNISPGCVTFEWKLWGTYTYNQDEINTWGIRKVMVDSTRLKLGVNQLVVNDKGLEAIVTGITPTNITILYATNASAAFRDMAGMSRQETLTQTDIDTQKVKVRAAVLTRQQRGCTGRRCV